MQLNEINIKTIRINVKNKLVRGEHEINLILK